MAQSNLFCPGVFGAYCARTLIGVPFVDLVMSFVAIRWLVYEFDETSSRIVLPWYPALTL